MKPRVFLASILSAVLLWCSFFPLNLGALAFVAMAPFLSLVRAEGIGRWRRYSAAFVGGLVFFFPALNWIRVAHEMMAVAAWPALSIACALFWPLALFLIRKCEQRGVPLLLSFPSVWVGMEYLRANAPFGFSFLQGTPLFQRSGFGWYFLGYTQHANIPLLQAADLGGVYIISFAVAAVNVAVYGWLERWNAFRWLMNEPKVPHLSTFYREFRITALAVSIVLLLVVYGTFRLIHKPFEQGPRVTALQGDLPQDEKNVRGGAESGSKVKPLDQLYRDLLAVSAGRADPKPDLIIWPETSAGSDWFETAKNVPDPPEHLDPRHPLDRDVPYYEWTRVARQKVAEAYLSKTNTHCLLGLNSPTWDGKEMGLGNTAVLLRPDYSSSPDQENYFGGRYDKMLLVPFGEYVPYRKYAPWLKVFAPHLGDYSCTPGQKFTRFELPVAKFRSGKEITSLGETSTGPNLHIYRFGVLICYEDTDPCLARQYNPASGQGQGVDFLVNMSNDGWFTGTEQHEQHLAICRFRAVESRRSVIRAVNMGISALIDSDGRVVAIPKDSWATSKGLGSRGFVSVKMPLDTRESVYARLGDWVPALGWFVIAFGLVPRALRRAKPVTTTA